MDFNPGILGKFRKTGDIKPASSLSGLPGKTVNKDGAKVLILSEKTGDIPFFMPAVSEFASGYENCLELIYGVRGKKTQKFAECGIKNLHDARKTVNFGVEAGRILSALDAGFEAVRSVLNDRFSASHRMFFLLLSYFKREELLFVDIETRSLNFETSIIMIGAGYFEGSAYRVDQFTALNEAGEYEVLQEFRKLLKGKKAFVTFNGKAFDIPYIDNRFAYYGDAGSCLAEEFHNFDLLHFSRCAFRGMYESYRLKEIEARILKKVRTNDIDGSEVDYYYSRYLQTHNVNFINPIIYHNHIDIVSLAELTGKLVEMWK
jgi:uncharacterized protein YprB with RNaseH-like and TPR domain